MALLQPQLLIWLLFAVAIVLALSSSRYATRRPTGVVEGNLCSTKLIGTTGYMQWLYLFNSQSRSRQVAWLCFGGALAVAVLLQRLSPVNAAGLLLVFLLLHRLKGGQQSWQRISLHSLMIVLALALSLHLLPGFGNWQQLDQIQLSAQSRPFSLYLNLDKPIVFFLLLFVLPDLPGRYQLNFRATWQLIWLSLLAILVLSWLAISAGFVAVEWKLPDWWWLFVLNNLLFTCAVEEAFFRGYLQRMLSEKTGPIAAIVLVALLFGLAHLAGGLCYALLASLAGLFYGYLYWRSGSLLVTIAGHFLLNFVHFVALTYPALR